MALTALLTAAVLAQAATVTTTVEGESRGATVARVSVAAGGALRNISLHRQFSEDYALTTGVSGLSPAQIRVAGAWLPWRPARVLSLGLAGDGTAAWYVATGDASGQDTNPLNDLARKPMVALRGGGGLAARWQPRPTVGVELSAGWAGLSVPVLDASGGAPTLFAGLTHGPSAGAVVGLDFGIVGVDVFARGTWGLAPVKVQSLPMRIGMVSGGGHVAVGNLRLAGLRGSVILEYEAQVLGRVGPSSALRYTEVTHQLGLGARVVIAAAEPPSGPGRVSGRVEAEGAPLAEATVSVGAASTVTDAQGHFELLGLGPGPVTGKVEAKGFDPKPLEAVVPPGGAVEVAVTLLRHKPTGPGSVQGVVELSPGKPVAGLEVSIEGLGTVQSGEDGRFVLPNIPPGVVSVQVRGKGYKPLTEAVRVAPEATAEVTLTVTKAGEEKPGVIRGFIQSANGKPFRATVKVVETNRSVKIGSNGRFEMTVPAGRYTLTISAPGFVTQTQNVELSGGDHAIFHCQLQPVSR